MTHRESLELLPWYATLDADRRRALDAHLRDCRECAAELAEIRSLRAAVSPLEDIPEASPFLLQRTLARIDAGERDQRPRRLLRWWIASSFATRMVMAAQLALVLALGAGTVYFQRRAAAYETLSGPNAAQSGPRFSVTFQQCVYEQAMREAVRSIGAVIVDGPSALGLYTLQIPREADPGRALQQLQANSAVIRFAQRNPD
jgi:hypothetical protein